MIKDIDTPALVVDLDKLENNIKVMAEKAKKAGINLRPHTKTHKSPEIAKKQIEAGAAGITVAKLGEAEVMQKHGIDDILIAYPIVGEAKLKRLEALAKKAKITVSLDSVEVAQGISRVGENIGRAFPIYVEVDTGLGRVGHKYGEETLALLEKIMELPMLDIQGLMTHAGHSYQTNTLEEIKKISELEGAYLIETRKLIHEKLGLYIPAISVGSTPTAHAGGQVEGVTELRPGTYVFNDVKLLSLGIISEDDCALTIYSTVVSRPASDRAIIDAGSKTLTSDTAGFVEGYGLLKSHPGLAVSWLSEEHGVVYLPENYDLKIGERVEIIPNHVCPTVNLTDSLVGVRNGEIEKEIEVAARGKNR